jgi:hypothetical protein
MAETHFHRLLKAKVAEVLEARRTQIASGICKDFDHYKYETGFIQGLLASLEIADDLEKELD